MSDEDNQFRFKKIDEFVRSRAKCIYLDNSDACVFLGEYFSGKGWGHSKTNSIVYNLKKKLGQPGYEYKQRDIETVAGLYYNALKMDVLKDFTLVPVPPSGAKGTQAYDSRMLDILNRLNDFAGGILDVRELVTQKISAVPSHLSTSRPTISDLINRYSNDESLVWNNPVKNIIVFDDVLTTGAHFKAMQSVLLQRFPGIEVCGAFFACCMVED